MVLLLPTKLALAELPMFQMEALHPTREVTATTLRPVQAAEAVLVLEMLMLAQMHRQYLVLLARTVEAQAVTAELETRLAITTRLNQALAVVVLDVLAQAIPTEQEVMARTGAY